MSDLRKQLDDILQTMPADDPHRALEVGNRRFEEGTAAIWAESTERGVVVYAQANGMRLIFGMTRAQAKHVAQLISQCAGGDA